MSLHKYVFTVISGPDIGRIFELEVGRTLLGRLEEQPDDPEDVRRWTFLDKTVSRVHAELVLKDPGVLVLNHLSKTNDTFVNKRRITSENLQDGQVFQMGQTAVLMEVVQRVSRKN